MGKNELSFEDAAEVYFAKILQGVFNPNTQIEVYLAKILQGVSNPNAPLSSQGNVVSQFILQAKQPDMVQIVSYSQY